ncbi:MAG: hypothetical protein WA635_12610 [Gallionella sp.]
MSILLLLAGCSSPQEYNDLSADDLAKRKAAVLEKCDFVVGPPRNSPDYLSCMEYMEAEMQ